MRERKSTSSYQQRFYYSENDQALAYSIVCDWLSTKDPDYRPDNMTFKAAKNHSLEIGDWPMVEKILDFLANTGEENDFKNRQRKLTKPYALAAILNQNFNAGDLSSRYKK